MKDKINRSRFLSESEQSGFVQSSSLVLLDSRVSDAAYRLYNVLRWHARNKEYCFPDMDRICAMLGKAKRSVYDILKELQNSGLISIESNYGKTNIYNIHPIDERYADKHNPMILSDDTLKYCNLKRVKDNDLGRYKIVPNCSREEIEKPVDVVDSEVPKKKRIDFKDSAEAASKRNNERIKKNREKTMMQSSGKMSDETTKVIIKDLGVLWFELWNNQFSDMPCPKWTAKEKANIKHLLIKYEHDDLRKLIEYVFNNWDDLQIKFRLTNHAPTVGLFTGYGDSWIQEIYRGKVNLKKKIINKDEYRKDDSPSFGWGDD